MFRHLSQLILHFIALDIQLHHILFNSGNLLGLVCRLSKFRVGFHAPTCASVCVSIPIVVIRLTVEATLEIT